MILDEDLTEFDKIGKLSYLPVVQNPDEQWNQAKGRITSEMLANFMPFDYSVDNKESLIMVCGPPALKDSIAEIAKDMELDNVFFFN